MLRTSVLFLLLFSVLASCQQEEKPDGDYDLIVYGGTSSGVMAAYAASMKGLKVLLVEPGRHIGGLSASGLGETDIGNKYTVSGLSRSFYRNLGAHYGQFEAWRFEPHVAEQLFNDYIAKTDVKLLLDTRIRAVSKSGTTITSITFENGNNPSGPLQSYS
ncbi:MAG: FAD-dependent oxidoreductase, partial [Mameliella sp.]|nr:FAD-dependent oxidoreductase [Phaeodactylibacter sp.]